MRERCGFHNYISWRTFRGKVIIERIGTTRGWGNEDWKKDQKEKRTKFGECGFEKRAAPSQLLKQEERTGKYLVIIMLIMKVMGDFSKMPKGSWTENTTLQSPPPTMCISPGQQYAKHFTCIITFHLH